MNNWKPLTVFLSTLIGCMILYLLTFIAHIGAPIGASYWVPEITTIKHYLANQISEPKILIDAGSSALYGFDSEQIYRETGMPVVNLGTMANMPINYRIKGLKQVAKSGDVIILALEYIHYARRQENEHFWQEITAWDKDYIVELPFQEKAKLLVQISPLKVAKAASRRIFVNSKKRAKRTRYKNKHRVIETQLAIWKGLKPSEENSYDAESTNIFGDQINLDGNHENLPAGGHYAIDGTISNLFKKSIKDLLEFSKENNVQILVTWPPTLNSQEFNINNKTTQKNLQVIIDYLATLSIPVLGNPEDFNYPRKFFHDSIHHLNDLGSAKRSKVLLTYLKPTLGVNENSATREIADNSFYNTLLP